MPPSPDELLEEIFDPVRRATLYPLYQQLRETAPVFKSEHPAVAGSWVLTRAADVNTVLRRFPFNTPEADAAQIYNLGHGGPFYETMRTMMQNLEAGDHQRLRRLVSPAFAAKAVQARRPMVERIVDDLIDHVGAAGKMDLIADFAHPFPAKLILTMMDIPEEDHDQLAGYADDFIRRLDIGDSLTPEVVRRGDEAAQFLHDYFSALLERRRYEPGDDLVSVLMSVSDAGDSLVPEEIVSTAIVIFEGGHQTTSNVFGTAMAALLANHDEAERFRRHPELTAGACEELLRYDCPVQANQRVVTEETELGGHVLRAGDKAFLFLGAANRDPEQFPDPDALVLDRANARSHFSFGGGAYVCLGAPLARLNFATGMRRLFDRLPGLRPDYETPEWQPTLINWGPAALPLCWDDVAPRG